MKLALPETPKTGFLVMRPILSKLLTLCMLGILHALLSVLSGIPSECQTSLDPDQMSGNCWQLPLANKQFTCEETQKRKMQLGAYIIIYAFIQIKLYKKIKLICSNWHNKFVHYELT